jgi:hypothetical protein
VQLAELSPQFLRVAQAALDGQHIQPDAGKHGTFWDV